ncbi:uncharacterized protein [Ptychodera flava]|uniref:uncharacterized protein n=1 Tax=Ptychodera flava TaxID=63121 RepID=UPI00396A1395
MGKDGIECSAAHGKPPANEIKWYADSILDSEVDPDISENNDGTFNSVSRLSLASFSKTPGELMCSVVQPYTDEVLSQTIRVASGADKRHSRLVTCLLCVASALFYLHYLLSSPTLAIYGGSEEKVSSTAACPPGQYRTVGLRCRIQVAAWINTLILQQS